MTEVTFDTVVRFLDVHDYPDEVIVNHKDFVDLCRLAGIIAKDECWIYGVRFKRVQTGHILDWSKEQFPRE